MIATNPIARAGAPDLTDDTLVGCWCSPYGNNPWQDVSTVGNHGTPTAVTREQEGAGGFNGTTSYINVPDGNPIGIGTSDFTITAWVKPTTLPNPARIVHKVSGLGAGYSFYESTGRLDAYVADPGGVGTTLTGTGTPLVIGQWSYVCMVCDRDGLTTFYADAIAAGSGSLAAESGSLASATDLRIGSSDSGTQPFNGSILDVRIYLEAKSLTWIRELYKAGVPR